MPDYLIRVDMGYLAAFGPVNKTAFPELNMAVYNLVKLAQKDWIESIRQAQGVWKGDKERYEKSLQARMVSDFEGEVWTDLKLAEQIDTGRPDRDLKKMLDTSLKVRVSSKGHRYLIIPFRHNIPGEKALAKDMPDDIYALAKPMRQSFVTGSLMRPTGQGSKGPFLSDINTKGPMMVPGHTYKWNDRLPAGLAEKLKPFHATDPFAGMVRMDNNGPKSTSSAYLTFRVMSESPHQARKWLVAKKPGLYLAKQVAAKVEAIAQASFEKAVELDFKKAGLG